VGVGLVMTLAGIILIILVAQFFKIQDFFKRPTDQVGPLLSLLATLTNIITALGFGKPYIAAYISIFGWLGSVFLCWLVPGLWEWSEKFVMVLATLGLGFQYFWNGIRHGNDTVR